MGTNPINSVLLRELDAMVVRAEAACKQRRQAIEVSKLGRRRSDSRLAAGLWSMERALQELQGRRDIEAARLQERTARALRRLR